MKPSNVKALIAISFACILLSIGFQNCSGLESTSSPYARSGLASAGSRQAQSGGPGNGEGYDGKPTYVNWLIGASCPDKSIEKARIEQNSAGIYELVRDNCSDIAPVAVDPSQWAVIESTAKFAQYRGRLFRAKESIGSGTSTSRNSGFTIAYCHAKDASDRVIETELSQESGTPFRIYLAITGETPQVAVAAEQISVSPEVYEGAVDSARTLRLERSTPTTGMVHFDLPSGRASAGVSCYSY